MHTNIEEIKKDYKILFEWTPKPDLDVFDKNRIPFKIIVVEHKQSTGSSYKDDVFIFEQRGFDDIFIGPLALQPFSFIIAKLLKGKE